MTCKAIGINLPFYFSGQHFVFFTTQKGSTSGPSKIRRIIENLRTDVLKGLGVKLLDRVLEIMEEEDDNRREVR